jgi:hypothetical protein
LVPSNIMGDGGRLPVADDRGGDAIFSRMLSDDLTCCHCELADGTDCADGNTLAQTVRLCGPVRGGSVAQCLARAIHVYSGAVRDDIRLRQQYVADTPCIRWDGLLHQNQPTLVVDRNVVNIRGLIVRIANATPTRPGRHEHIYMTLCSEAACINPVHYVLVTSAVAGAIHRRAHDRERLLRRGFAALLGARHCRGDTYDRMLGAMVSDAKAHAYDALARAST